MPVYKWDPEEALKKLEGHEDPTYLLLIYLKAKARGGWIKQIIWSTKEGYPAHAEGFVQISVRPYLQGDGCDGTTDEPIHLIAMTMCERAGLDYIALLEKAHPEDFASYDFGSWMRELAKDRMVAKETIIPDKIDVALALDDLGDINWHRLVDVLTEAFIKKGLVPADFRYWLDSGKYYI